MKRQHSLGLAFLVLAMFVGCGSDESTSSNPGGAPACTPTGPEVCNGKDDDCDGVLDDGPCSAPTLDKAKFLAGSGTDVVRGIAADNEGNIYLTGHVSPPADLGGPVKESQGFVASFDAQGALRWFYPWGNPSDGYSYGQDLSFAGDKVCMGGFFSGPFDFGGGVRTSQGYNDAVVLCLNAADGSYRWDRAFGDTHFDVVEGVRVDASGDVTVVGNIEQGSADFGAGVVPNVGFFVARYAPDGALRWTRTYATAGAIFSQTPAVDSSGNVYTTGRFSGTLDFGGGPRSAGASGSSFVLALDAQGNHRWDIVSSGSVDFYGAAVQSNNTLVVAGDFSGSFTLGGANMSSSSPEARNLFAVALDPGGKALWSYRADGESSRGFSLAIGPSDEIAIAGSFAGSPTFGDTAETNKGMDDMHVVGLTADGKFQWSKVFGGSDVDELNAVAFDSKGNIVVGGESRSNLDIDGAGSLTNAGDFDGVILYLRR